MSATKTWKGPVTALVELPDSPVWEFGDVVTQTRSYKGLHSFCLQEAGQNLLKNTLGAGDFAGFKVVRTRVTRERGDVGKLEVVWASWTTEATGSALPEDEFAVIPENLSPRIEKHELFSSLDTEQLALVHDAVQGATEEARQEAWDELVAQGNVFATDLVEKLERGQESYYLCALRYVWVTHSWTLPTIDRGGYVQAPLGPLAGYFVSDIDWLREADDLQYQNGIYRWTRSWLGGPLGHWDLDLYAL